MQSPTAPLQPADMDSLRYSSLRYCLRDSPDDPCYRLGPLHTCEAETLRDRYAAASMSETDYLYIYFP